MVNCLQFNFIIAFIVLANTLVSAADNKEYGIAFQTYEGRTGESLSLDCVTNTATLIKFTHKNRRSVEQDFYYTKTPTILHNYKYLLYKQSYSKLLRVYSMIITKLDYNDEGRYTCHTSDGRQSHSYVIVLRQNGEWHNIIFTQPNYIVARNTPALLTCLRPLGQKFHRFYFRRKINTHKEVIQNGVEGYRIEQDNIYNNTQLRFLLSGSSKIGFYECSAGEERTLTKLSMKCEIPDVSLRTIIVLKGSRGVLKVNWVGNMLQQGMLTAWEKLPRSDDVSVWRYDYEYEIAARFNRKFYATVSSKYEIDEDGTLAIKASSKADAGYYKFRLICGRDFEKSLLVNVVVVG